MSDMQQKLEITINEEMNGTRLDLVLSVALEEFSRSFIQKLFENGRITVDGQVCKEKKIKATTGSVVVIDVPEPEKLEVEAEEFSRVSGPFCLPTSNI